MGPPRGPTAREKRAQRGRVRLWLWNAAARARTLLSSAEAAESVLREVLGFFGEERAGTMPVARAAALLQANREVYVGRLEPGEAELMANVGVLAEMLKLNAPEQEVLSFFAAIPSQPALQQTLCRIDVRSRHQIAALLAVVLEVPIEHIRQAMASDAPLARFQIVRALDGGVFDFSQLALMNEDLERALASSVADVDELLGAFFVRAPMPSLELSDFAHLARQTATLMAYLRGADEAKAIGVNVLFYGLPGTGKTELARLIARELEWQAFEVRMCNRDTTPSSGDERVGSFLLAQRFLHAMERRVVIFDEVEDLFAPEFGFQRARLNKLYMNRLLELNAVPAIWIANDVSALSLAVRRRFAMSIAFGPLPKRARSRVLQRHLQGQGVGGPLAGELLRREWLLPAQVSGASQVAALSGAEDALLELIDSSMKLLEQPVPRVEPALEFDLALANADMDLERVLHGLRDATGRSLIALHGAPGVGKSAFAAYIAEQLARSVVRIAAADVLSAFVGETEQRIAAIFDAIEPEGELLVIEEADQLLADRGAARQSWESRMVNEMLVHLDRFKGTAILTTNALESLDVAVLRRCELKIKLLPLSGAQREEAWRRKLGAPPATEIRQRLLRLEGMTAGDMAAVARQAEVIGAAWTALDWILALERELSLRPQARSAGFVAAH